MIIIQVAGGLGNQMQQYALYQKFLSMGIDSRLDISWFTQPDRQNGVYARREFELSNFADIDYETCTDQEKQRLTGGDGFGGKVKRKLFAGKKYIFMESDMYHPEIFTFTDKYLCGYWACEKYYGDIMDTLQKQLTFPQSRGKNNEEMADQMRKRESVSVHIRRGDYLDAENMEMFGNICTGEYYDAAMKLVRERHHDAHFYLFSDDSAYVRENYTGDEYTVVDLNKGKDSFFDIWLMSQCKHNICANSTFSFWGARLNTNKEKMVIRPYIHKNTQVFDADQMHELWKGWILLDPRGNCV